mmetsp:Transcript_10863/g.12848  ORF Transcript_10863/g.12848 Transcript_10863/m.12848 type:complete len:203 (-) Transcript_10863:168-776(-)
MAFTKTVLLGVLATLSASNAFAPLAQSNYKQSSVIQQKQGFGKLCLAMDDVEDLVVAEPAPEDFIVNVGDIDDEPSSDDDTVPGWQMLNERIAEARAKYRRADNDTGSPEFQVAGMTERIGYLTEHLKLHPKDFSTRRGLVALVNKRRRLLNFLFKEDVERYRSVVTSMGIRHKAPGKVLGKEQMYGRFPQQKPKQYANKEI